MEIVDSIIGSSISNHSIVRYIGLGEEIGNIRSWVNDRCTNYANGIRNICATDIGLEERSMNLASINKITGFSIQRPDIILGRSKKK